MAAAFNKEKVIRIEIYDANDRYIAVTKVFSFPKELFKGGGRTAVSIKCSSLPLMRKGDSVKLIFEYMNGTRYRTETRIDAAVRSQIDVHVSELTELEERRRFFKVNTREKATVYRSKAENAEGCDATILNINLGGVLLKCGASLNIGDEIYLNTLDGTIELKTKILRKQTDAHGVFIGYGCQFVEPNEQEEEILSKYILECQVLERERRKRLEEDMGE